MPERERQFDTALFAKAQRGDAAAQQELLLEYFDPLHRRIASRMDEALRLKVTADDLIQDAFVEAVRDLPKCKASSRGEFIAWLCVIADNRLRQARRHLGRAKRGGRHRQVQNRAAGRSSILQALDLFGTDDGTPSKRAAVTEAERAIHVGVATLPPDQREAIERRFLAGEALDEIAKRMNKSPGAVRGLLHRAKLALRDTMGRSSRWFSRK